MLVEGLNLTHGSSDLCNVTVSFG